MKLIALAVVAIVGLAGCAASQPTARFTTEPDLAKMQAIEQAARSQGVLVVWVNAPQKVVRVAGS